MPQKSNRLTRLPTCTLTAATSGGSKPLCPQCLQSNLSKCLEFDEAAANQLATKMVQQHYVSRQVILNAGDDAISIGVISEGLAAVVLHTEDGRRQITGFLNEGDLFGFTSDDTYFASVEAITEVTACLFPRPLFETLVFNEPSRSKQMVRMVSQELAEAAHHQVLLGRMTARERVAAFLDDLRLRIGENLDQDTSIQLNMTRADIGDYLGLSMEHVSRGFSQLAREGIIELMTPQSIYIRETNALERLVHR